jgi:hypothetical protein
MRKSKSTTGETRDNVLARDQVPLIGPMAAAQIMGWKHRSSFYKHFNEGHFPEIRSVFLLKGRYYVLEDVFATAFPEASQEQLQELIIEYRVNNGKKVKAMYGSKEYLESKVGSPLSRFS